MFVQLPSAGGRVVTGPWQRDPAGLVPGWFGQVTLQKQCLSTLEVGHLGAWSGIWVQYEIPAPGKEGGRSIRGC